MFARTQVSRYERELIEQALVSDRPPPEAGTIIVVLPDTAEFQQLADAGADIIELGVPFSDPIADGPVIQQAAERALRSGTSLKKILATVRSLRTKTQIPLVLMAYYNSIFRYGEAAFCLDAVVAGVDGLIVPDMPPDEAGTIHPLAEKAGLAVVFLLAPTSTAKRQTRVARLSRGFIYYVSLTGITGAKLTDKADVEKKVREIRRYTKTPVAVGFGIATPEDARAVARIADGVIVGSALVKIGDGVTLPARLGVPDRHGREAVAFEHLEY